jgi:hypothetical protein
LSNNTPLSAPFSVKPYRVTHHRAKAGRATDRLRAVFVPGAWGSKGLKLIVFGRPA